MQAANLRHQQPGGDPDLLTKVVLNNVPDGRTEDQLKDTCLAYGPLRGFRLNPERRSAVVVFERGVDAELCASSLDLRQWTSRLDGRVQYIRARRALMPVIRQ